jgi:repressor of nif and glnA expression
MLQKSERIIDIINDLHEKGVINYTDNVIDSMTGTTDGLVYTLSVNSKPKYVLKLDHHQQIILVEQLLLTYQHTTLLPKLLFFSKQTSGVSG